MQRIFPIPGIVINFLFCALTLSFAQEFEFKREADTIPIFMDGMQVHSPFAGGFVISKPAFADIDNDGDLDCFVGMRDGDLLFFRNTGSPLVPVFSLDTELLSGISVGKWTSPAFADIDNDGDFDLFIGESFGDIRFYRNTGSPENPEFTLVSANYISIGSGLISPAFADLDSDGDLDLLVGENDGNINFFRNTGTTTIPVFTLEDENFSAIKVRSGSTPALADIDNDGDFDLFIGEQDGNISFYRNTGTPTNYIFSFESGDIAFEAGRVRSAPAFADIDNDGNLELFVGQTDGPINYFRSNGDSSNILFLLDRDNLISIDNFGGWSSVTVIDIDNDQKLDLFIGNYNSLDYYRNIGTLEKPEYFLESKSFGSIIGPRPQPVFADIDKDNDLDVFFGDVGNIYFFRNIGSAPQPVYGFYVE